jgi:hypothetical protein
MDLYTGIIRAYGRPVTWIEVRLDGVYLQFEEGETKIHKVPYDAISWTSRDWDKRDA